MADVSNSVNSKQSLILLVMYKHVYNVNTFNTLSTHQWKGAGILSTSGEI